VPLPCARYVIKYRAIGTAVTVAGAYKFLECCAHRLQFADLFFDFGDMQKRYCAHVLTGAIAIPVQRHELAAILD
jgi:hypothetical protein